MKRIKKITSVVILIVAIFAMTIPSALAYSPPDLTLDFNSYPSTLTVQVVNTATLESDLAYAMCTHLEVGMYLYEAQTPFGGVARVICDDYNLKGSSTDYSTGPWLAVSYTAYNYQLDENRYYIDEGVAVAEFYVGGGDEPDIVQDMKIMYYDGTTFTNGTNAASIDSDTENASLEFGKTIAEEFSNVPSNYQPYYNSEIEEAIGPLNYLSIRRNLYLCYEDTVPTYFLSPDGNTIIAVKQDGEGVKYSRKFVKNEENKWEASGDFSMICTESTVTSAETTLYETEGTIEAIPENYSYVTGSDLCQYLDSVETYLLVRKLLGGGNIEAYYLSEDGESLAAIHHNSFGESCVAILEPSENGQWNLVHDEVI